MTDRIIGIPESVLLRARNALKVWYPDDGALAHRLEEFLVTPEQQDESHNSDYPKVDDMPVGTRFNGGMNAREDVHQFEVREYDDGTKVLYCHEHKTGAKVSYVDPSTIRDVVLPSPLWCANDEKHEAHKERNEFGGFNECTGRP